jgi:hypothetical protein
MLYQLVDCHILQNTFVGVLQSGRKTTAQSKHVKRGLHSGDGASHWSRKKHIYRLLAVGNNHRTQANMVGCGPLAEGYMFFRFFRWLSGSSGSVFSFIGCSPGFFYFL